MFTTDVIETWIRYKRENEAEAVAFGLIPMSLPYTSIFNSSKFQVPSSKSKTINPSGFSVGTWNPELGTMEAFTLASFRGHLAFASGLGFIYGGRSHSQLEFDPATAILARALRRSAVCCPISIATPACLYANCLGLPLS